LEHG
jgi:glycerol 2-dehydrogenase (NADP+)